MAKPPFMKAGKMPAKGAPMKGIAKPKDSKMKGAKAGQPALAFKKGGKVC